MKIVFAPDSFKGSASAATAATLLAEGWLAVRPHDETIILPMADGGEGTSDAVRAAVPSARPMPVTVTGPDGRPVEAEWLLLPDGTALIELAKGSGILLLGTDETGAPALSPGSAHTVGLGELIADALAHDVRRISVAIGGSASSDGGAGMLTALGARILDETGSPVAQGNDGLERAATVEISALHPLPPEGAQAWIDVTNPLLGENGAIAVFGAQKGVAPDVADPMERRLEHYATLVEAAVGTRVRDEPGAGAAGGTGFGLLAWGATTASGGRSVAEVIGLAQALAECDLVVTGEGRFDAQSAQGKVVSAVTELAGATPVALAAGSIALDARDSLGAFATSVSLTALAGAVESAMADAERWLREAGAALARAVTEADRPAPSDIANEEKP